MGISVDWKEIRSHPRGMAAGGKPGAEMPRLASGAGAMISRVRVEGRDARWDQPGSMDDPS